MQQLAPEYLIEIGRQIAFLGAFLGGFAATLAGTLVMLPADRKGAVWAIGAAACSAVAFVVAVVAATSMTIVLHPDAPAIVAADDGSQVNAKVTAAVAFGIGMYSLLFSVGACGWLHSRPSGRLTTAIAIIGAVFVSWALTGF